MTGSGGWPLSLFLFPDGKPFYGGTYFPPDDRYGRPGFSTLLAAIARAWSGRRSELERSARDLMKHLEAGHGIAGGGDVGPAVLESAARALSASFDEEHGGFDGAPKFPPAMRLEFLIRYWLRTGAPRARTIVETTLKAWRRAACTTRSGRFHRYSVDARWLVRLREDASTTMRCSRASMLASRAFDDRSTRGSPGNARIPAAGDDAAGGGLRGADADSEGVEGTFYVWDRETLEAAVGAEDARLVARGRRDGGGHFEHGRRALVVRSFAERGGVRLTEERVAR